MVRSHDFRPPFRKASFRCVCSSGIRARLSIGTRHPTALVRERARINPVTWLIPRTSNVCKLALGVRKDLRCRHARVVFLCACTMLFGQRHLIQLGGAGGVGGAGCSRDCRPAVFVKSRCGSAKCPSGGSGGAIRKRAWWADVTGRFEADPFACSMFTAPVALYGPRCATTGLATADNGFGPCPLRCCAGAIALHAYAKPTPLPQTETTDGAQARTRIYSAPARLGGPPEQRSVHTHLEPGALISPVPLYDSSFVHPCPFCHTR